MNSFIWAGIFFSFYLITKLLLSLYIYNDAKALQLKATLWSLIVMLLPNYIGFVLYLIIRTVTLNKTLDEKEKMMNIQTFKKPILLIISILFLGTSYYFLGNYFNDTFSSKFDNYQDAVATIERGWIPKHIPKTATDIYEVHNIDTNIGNGIFKLSKEESINFYSTLNPIEKNEMINLKSIKKKWWDQNEIKKNIENDHFLLGKREHFIYAIDPNGTVYFWIQE